MNLDEHLYKVLNKLAKWRTVFAGWQLGTRQKSDPECAAVVDHRELSILLRVELTALTNLLIAKGVVTKEEFEQSLVEEAERLDKEYEKKFNGARSHEFGIEIYDLAAWEKTTKGWKP